MYTIHNNDLANAATAPLAVIDFSATWCGPCKMLAPIFHELAEEMADDALFCAADVDENLDLARKYGVMVVPTLIILKDGQEVARNTGVQPKNQLREWILAAK